MLVEVLCLIVALYVLIRLWYENHIKLWKDFEQVPLPRYTLLGHIPSINQMSHSEFSKNIHIWLENSKTDSILLWMACSPWLITRNRLLFENVLSSNKHIKKSENYWAFKDWLGDSVLVSDGGAWRKRRKLLTPSFHFNILQGFDKTMEKHSLELVNALMKPAETGKTFNVFTIMKRYAIGIISETAMGVESNVVKTVTEEDSNDMKEEDRKFIDTIIATDRLLETIDLRLETPWYWYKSVFKMFPIGSQYYKDLQKMKSFAKAIIEERIQKLEKDEGLEDLTSIQKSTNSMRSSSSSKATFGNCRQGTIFIDMMLSLYIKGEISIDDILNEIHTFIFAGYDTVATALSFALYLLGRNKTQQGKAYEEVMRVKALGLPITESIQELHYIECVIKEVLRIHPPVGMISRFLKEDSEFGKESYPQGTNMILCINEIQRDAKNYEEPMVFKPERFFHVEDGVSIKQSSHYTFTPFSAGPRNCIGQKLAMMEMKTTLYHLLSEYEVIATQKEEDLKESFSIIHVVENENGLEIKFRKR